MVQKYLNPHGVINQLIKYGILLLALPVAGAQAQITDSIGRFMQNKPSPIGGLSGRYSLVAGKPNRIAGIYGGAAYGEKFKLWAGWYWMNEPLSELIADPKQPQLGFVSTKYESMRYLSVAAEYAFLHRNNWKLSVPVQLGIGGARTWYVSKIDKQEFNKSRKAVFPLEAGFNAQYLFFEWLGLKAGLGTRFALGNGTSAVYSGPYSTIGMLFYFGPLYRKLPQEWQVLPEF